MPLVASRALFLHCIAMVIATAMAALATTAAHADTPPESRLEGAIGLIASNAPEFAGADARRSKVAPGFFLRYGRLSVTNASGFVTRRNEEVERGLDFELQRSEVFRVNVALRFDGGRSEGDSPALAGLGDVRATVRTRLSATWRPLPTWRVGAAWSLDVLGRGGGSVVDANVAREFRFSPTTTWAAGAALSLADARYMQSYFGVTPAQSTASGYAVFVPHAGLRDASVFANARHEISPRWVALGGTSFTHLLGPVAASPHTRRSNSLAVNAGLAWLF